MKSRAFSISVCFVGTAFVLATFGGAVLVGINASAEAETLEGEVSLAGLKQGSNHESPGDEGDGIDTLIVGGGSSHDFDRWFNRKDSKILEARGLADVDYTDDVSQIRPKLDKIDVLYLSNNQPMKDPALRQGIFEFVRGGGGLLVVHAAVWYNWQDWREYNQKLVGGGSRGHDHLGEFKVELTEKTHPVTDGVSDSFAITDELYHFREDPEGTPIRVLADAYSEQTESRHPIVWEVKHPKSRIVGISLGHDGRAHRHTAYRHLLRNALRWVAPKNR